MYYKAYTKSMQELLPWDVIVAQFFPRNLEGIALDWYYHLPLASIRSFQQVIGEFVIAFDMNKFVKTRIQEFLTVKEETNKFLAHFITCWRQVFYSSTSVPNMDHRELCDLYLHALNRDMLTDVV